MKLKELQHLIHALGGDENTEIIFKKDDEKLKLLSYRKYRDRRLIGEGIFEEDKVDDKDIVQITFW